MNRPHTDVWGRRQRYDQNGAISRDFRDQQMAELNRIAARDVKSSDAKKTLPTSTMSLEANRRPSMARVSVSSSIGPERRSLGGGPLSCSALRNLGELSRLAVFRWAPNWVDNGPGWLAVLLRSKADVLALRPDFTVLSGLRVGVVAPWDPMKDGRDADFEVRAFTAAGFEDQVTGSLNAGIAQWLIGNGIAPPSYIASQGTVLRREGRVHVEKIGDQIWIGGDVTTCIEGVAAV